MSTDYYGQRGQAIGKVARSFEEITGRMLTRPILDDIGYYIDRGCEPDLFIKAFEVTADKARGWAYTRGILQNCVEDRIMTAYDWEWRVKLKKGLSDIKRQYGELDDATLGLILMATVFKEDVENIAKDLERYLEAVANGDTAEWDTCWQKFETVESGTM